MSIVTFHTVWTLIVLLLLIGLVAWTWSPANNDRFERAARLPLDDEQPEFVKDLKRTKDE